MKIILFAILFGIATSAAAIDLGGIHLRQSRAEVLAYLKQHGYEISGGSSSPVRAKKGADTSMLFFCDTGEFYQYSRDLPGGTKTLISSAKVLSAENGKGTAEVRSYRNGASNIDILLITWTASDSRDKAQLIFSPDSQSASLQYFSEGVCGNR